VNVTAQVRREFVDRLKLDLLGPDAADEETTDLPSDRYLTGILFPQKTEVPDDEKEELQTEETDGGEQAESDAAGLFLAVRPASAGFSFAVATDGSRDPEIELDIACGKYVRVSPESGGAGRAAKIAGWRRHATTATVPLRIGAGEQRRPVPGIGGLDIYLRASRVGSIWAVTCTLINCNQSAGARVDDEERTFFQVQMKARCCPGTRFAPRPSRRHAIDEDGRIAELIYRGAREYAVGHTCSAAWRFEGAEVTTIETTWLPEATVHLMSAEGDPSFQPLRADPAVRPLSASWLARAPDAALIQGLRRVIGCYRDWLEGQEKRIAGLPAELREQAARNIRNCRDGADRMESGISLLESSRPCRAAFRLAQHAMVIQRRWSRGDADLTWRPFQLGFQLLALESLASPEHPDRGIMDLLWFPTGGGKTEAYLALTAFILFLRRLRQPIADEGAGVAVLMRYTLRLLTIQQFQRAAALVMACEHLRRGKERLAAAGEVALGSTPFSIGLWVGGGATPNSFDEAVQALGGRGGECTPAQLVDCPCCHGKLAWADDRRARQVTVSCRSRTCDLAAGGAQLPVWTVDSDIYSRQPSLLIATVDKYAQIARKPETTALFGLGASPRPPPDLVIQDELHLISGPLGTLTGIYETAIDFLCTRGKVRPKIIGSTATIRRASEQIRALFDRATYQFPPPCIDASNSGFAVEDRAVPGRSYIALSTVGRSPKFALQAACASLLQSAEGVSATPEERDPYWTLVTYFNSLRELGGALVLMLDDVPASLQNYSRRRADPRRRRVAEPVELTSRVSSRDIPDILKDLQRTCVASDAVDVLLASNMISVGVDIPRLGLMVVNGQPKTIAEYIQATSRVGREKPGLVLVVENHGRVRDRSHFETFATWHTTIYREVEATSVTPFASRARDKALPAVLVAMARHLVTGLMTQPLLDPATASRLKPVLDEIRRRVASVMPAEEQGVAEKLRALVDEWKGRSDIQTYWDVSGEKESLLLSAEQVAALGAQGISLRAWAAPNSMREVEAGTPYQLKEGLSAAAGANQGSEDAE
jgi:hypothetical protein